MTTKTATLRCGVIGVGKMGRHHARLWTQLEGCDLVGVVDTSADRRKTIIDQYGGKGYDTVDALIEAGVDVVTIATPTVHHREAAEKLLARGVHCLIEKPLAPTVADARAIADAAKKSGALLQVGHVVRYDPVMVAIRKLELKPRFAVVDRVSPMTFRSVDVGVVLDMMIHDIDVLLMLFGAEPATVYASAVSVLGEAEDVCNARLEFPRMADGYTPVANVTASRIAMKTERRMRVMSDDTYVSADFVERRGTVARKHANAAKIAELRQLLKDGADLSHLNFLELLQVEELDVAPGEPLKLQAEDFIDAVRNNRQPFVDAEDGFAAVRTADRIVAAARAAGSRML